jgi:AcrR family transcriptional regulator
MTDVAPRQLRADARRNRERVLEAAEVVFSEAGLKAQIDEVARRAGVGVGTVCRNFPTKQALLESVLTSMYTSLLEQAEGALATGEPAAAFEQFVLALSAFQARHRAFAEQMANESVLPETAHELRDALTSAIARLVAGAQAAGTVRDDIGPADVSLLFSGVAHATAVAGDFQPALRERYVRLILDGLRPAVASKLPGAPLDFAQLRRIKNAKARKAK